MSGSAIENFFVALGFEIDSAKLKEFESDVASARDTMLSIGAAAGVAAAAIGGFVHTMAVGMDQLGDFAEMEEYSAQALQEIGHAAQISGSSLEAVKQSLSAVNKTVGEAVLGIGRGKKAFDDLGLSAKNVDGSVKTFDQILDDVSDKMQGMSRQEAIAMAEKLGIDRTLIPMLMKGKDAIRELREEAAAFGTSSDEDLAAAGDYTDAFDRALFIVKSLSRTIAVQLMPIMTGMLNEFRKWVMVNREVIKTAITKTLQLLIAVIGTLWDYVVRGARVLAGLIQWLTNTTAGLVLLATALALVVKVASFKAFWIIANGIRLVAAALTVANTAALVTSAILGGIIIALALLIDDFINWKEGNESVIGDLIEQFPQLLTAIQAVEEFVDYFVDFWMAQWNNLREPLGNLMSAVGSLVAILAQTLWPIIKTIFVGWGHILSILLPIVVGFITTVIQGWVNLISWITAGITGVVNGITSIVDAVQKKVMGFIDGVIGAFGKIGKMLGLTSGDMKVAVSGSGSSANGGPGASGGLMGRADSMVNNSNAQTNNQTTITAPITINSPDPAKAGQAVADHLNRANKSATRNGQTAVAL